MKLNRDSLLVYAVTDRAWVGDSTLAEQVEQAIKGGASFIQLREKDTDYESFLKLAKEIKEVTDKYQVPFVINDNIEVAIACDADGIHVGQEDMAAGQVRKRLGENKIIGVSAENVALAKQAEANGADYIGSGAMYSTATKAEADTMSFETLRDICSTVSIPVVAIGGIKEHNIMELKGSGIAGISVVSAIFAQPDITAATQRLAKLAAQVVNI